MANVCLLFANHVGLNRKKIRPLLRQNADVIPSRPLPPPIFARARIQARDLTPHPTRHGLTATFAHTIFRNPVVIFIEQPVALRHKVGEL
jgi:hypothetical protein